MYRWLWLSLVVVALDQLSKQLIESSLMVYETIPVLPFFNLTLAYNEGAAFSFLSEQGLAALVLRFGGCRGGVCPGGLAVATAA